MCWWGITRDRQEGQEGVLRGGVTRGCYEGVLVLVCQCCSPTFAVLVGFVVVVQHDVPVVLTPQLEGINAWVSERKCIVKNLCERVCYERCERVCRIVYK